MIDFLRKNLPDNVFFRRWFSLFKASLAAVIYGFPARKIKIIGITGTDGKTTTTEMLFHILKKVGIKVAKISSVKFSIHNETWENRTKRTTVSPFLMQWFLRKCVKEKIEYAVIEVSSHSLAQKRVWGIDFDGAILTNVSHEHLDYHGTIDKLRDAKKVLFTEFLNKNGVAIINGDDEVAKIWKEEIPQIRTFSFKNKKADYFGENFKDTNKGLEFTIGKTKFTAEVLGNFNAENLLGAISCLLEFKIDRNKIAEAAKDFSGIPGRLENLDFGQDFQVFVDFALTPQAFEKVLSFLKKRTNGNLITVFGAAGDHDKTKRPQLGMIAKKYANSIILTDDETYTEDPQQIRDDIRKGIFENKDEVREISLEDKSFFEIPNRKTAIETAIQIANSGDIVIVSGMGALLNRNMGGVETPWSDKQIIMDSFAGIQKFEIQKNLGGLKTKINKE